MKIHTLKMRRVAHSIVLFLLLFALPALPTAPLGRAAVAAQEPDIDGPYHIALKSRQFVPAPGFEAALTQELARATSERDSAELSIASSSQWWKSYTDRVWFMVCPPLDTPTLPRVFCCVNVDTVLVPRYFGGAARGRR